MKTTSAKAAQAIKKELKEKFPTIKFSVKSDNFAGGDAVRINYEDGVPTKDIKSIVDKYQYGHFDGMTDCYEYSNDRKDIPQAKYVQVQRDITEEATKTIVDRIKKDYGLSDWNDEIRMKTFGMWSNQKVYKTSQDMDFIHPEIR